MPPWARLFENGAAKTPCLDSILMISILSITESAVTDHSDKPGHLARRFQQIAVAVFHAEVEAAGFDLTPVQYAALTAIATHPGVDQVTLAGLIAFDRTTITGVVDRLVQKDLAVRPAHSPDPAGPEAPVTP